MIDAIIVSVRFDVLTNEVLTASWLCSCMTVETRAPRADFNIHLCPYLQYSMLQILKFHRCRLLKKPDLFVKVQS